MSETDDPTNRVQYQIFVKGDNTKEPVKFFLHDSLTRGQQERLELAITDNGGVLVAEAAEADTVLVHHEAYDRIAKRWDHSKTVWVEKPDFVDVCLRRKLYSHAKPLKRSLGGRRPGGLRREFTFEDDMHLAEYIARRVPDPEAGGRIGLGIYSQLCDPDRKEMYPWASRHPEESWRSRYRNNTDRFNKTIESYLACHPPHPDGKGEYIHDRRVKKHWTRTGTRDGYIRRSGREQEETSEEEGEAHSSQNDGPEWKRKRLGNANQSSAETPEQARKGREHVSMEIGARADHEDFEEFQVDLDNVNLYHFDDDGDQFPGLAGILPENTQAKLVSTQRADGRTEKDVRSVETTTPVTLTAERRKAARNRERSAAVKAGATGRTVLPVSPPKDTQATLVATQPRAQSTTQAQAIGRQNVTERGPASVTETRSENDANGANIVNNLHSSMPGPSAQRKRLVAAPQPRAVTTDAPFRNTRARSRSVEPMPPPLPVRKRGRAATMQKLEEEEEDHAIVAIREEEQSLDVVEAIIGQEEEEEEEEEIVGGGELAKERQKEEEEDQSLDEEEDESQERPGTFSFRARAREIRMKKLSAIESTPRASFSAGRPKTSTHRAESSEGEFPTPGTRSEEAKAFQEQAEKQLPFTPTPGTRAERVRATQRQVMAGTNRQFPRFKKTATR